MAKNTLFLPLKKKWFDMIKAGIKKEEYREISEYWFKRFCGTAPAIYRIMFRTCMEMKDYSMVKETNITKYDKLVFTLGYPKADDTERRLEFKNPKIQIGKGKPEWGANPSKTYFVITWKD